MRPTNKFIIIILTLMLYGCGQTGPLYLPSQQPEPKHKQNSGLL